MIFSKILVVAGVTLVGVCCLVSFPLMVEEVSKRVGHDYVNSATGMVYFLAQFLTAFITYILGFVMDEGTEISTGFTLVIASGGLSVSFIFGVLADCLKGRKFKGYQIKESEEGDVYNKV